MDRLIELRRGSQPDCEEADIRRPVESRTGTGDMTWLVQLNGAPKLMDVEPCCAEEDDDDAGGSGLFDRPA